MAAFYGDKKNRCPKIPKCPRHVDFREVLGRKDVDAVMISTPDHWHVPMSVLAVKAGKDVSCEKPLTRSIAEGRLLSDLVTRHKRVFRTDSEFRSLPQFHRAVELVRNGRIGKLLTIRTGVPGDSGQSPKHVDMAVPTELDYELWQGPAPVRPYTEQRVHQIKGYVRPGWMNIRDYSDGKILNWTTHLNDIAQWGNDTDRTGPVAVEGHGKYPPAGSLWDVCYQFRVHLYVRQRREADLQDGRRVHSVRGNGGLGPGHVRRQAAFAGRAQVASGLEDRPQRDPLPPDARETRLPQRGEEPRPDAGRRRGRTSHGLARTSWSDRDSSGPTVEVGPGQGAISRRRRGQPDALAAPGPRAVDHLSPRRNTCSAGLPPRSEERPRHRCTTFAVCGLLLLAVALVFGQTVRFDFVNFDDQSYVYENAHVRKGVTPEGVVWAFTTLDANNWHPLAWLSHMLDFQCYGLWAGGHHLTNVLLHALSVVVLFLVLRQMTGRLWPSALVAAVFAIHPLHVESVAWVAERKDVLSGLFFVLTLAAYLGYVGRQFSTWRYLLVVVLLLARAVVKAHAGHASVSAVASGLLAAK